MTVQSPQAAAEKKILTKKIQHKKQVPTVATENSATGVTVQATVVFVKETKNAAFVMAKKRNPAPYVGALIYANIVVPMEKRAPAESVFHARDTEIVPIAMVDIKSATPAITQVCVTDATATENV